MRYLLLIGCFFSLWINAQPLQEAVQQKLNIPMLQGAWWGGVASYADEPQQILFAVQENQRTAPASTLKLLTTAAALHALGPQHRFETRLYISTPPDNNGVLRGDVLVRGGGDMTLGSTRVKGSPCYQAILNQWVKALQHAVSAV